MLPCASPFGAGAAHAAAAPAPRLRASRSKPSSGHPVLMKILSARAASRASTTTTARSTAASGSSSDSAWEGSYLVTGAAGFIGSHLVERLLSRGAAVIAVDSLDCAEAAPYPVEWKRSNVALLRRKAEEHASTGARLTFHEVDAGDRDRMRAIFCGGVVQTSVEQILMPPVTRVCHLAARSGVKGSVDVPEGAVAANVASTAVLLDLAAALECRAFVLASSGSVYGECAIDASGDPVPSKEFDVADAPISPYAATKRAAELMAHAFWHMTKVPVTVCRIFTVYGPRGRPDMAVYRFIVAVLAGKGLTRFGDGMSTWRDYCHVDDVVAGLIAALHREEGGNGKKDDGGGGFVIVNLASGVPTRLGELIAAVEAAVGSKAEITEQPGRPGDVGGTYADVSCAERVLGGWCAMTTLEEGVRRTADWYSSEEAQDYGALEECLRKGK